jgi:hypothetical protein
MSHSLPESQTNASFLRTPAVRLDRLALGLALILAATTIAKFTIRSGEPLWLDEAWTGMIAGQRSIVEAARQARFDANAPLYYLVSWLWAPIGGLSDGALRLPATLFGVAAPLLALAPARSLPRQVRFLWCALLACWIPGLIYSQDARCYTLLLLLGVGNVILFAEVLARPTLRSAALWCAASALFVLTHYYAALLVGLQGVVYLALGRGRALATWPAALAFAPAAAWMAVHVPRMAVYMRPGVAWQPMRSWADLPSMGEYALGAPVLGVLLWLGAALVLSRTAPTSAPATSQTPPERALWIAAAVSVVALALALGLALLRPTLAERYLTPFSPGLLLGLALLGGHFGRRWALAPALLALIYVASTGVWIARSPAIPSNPYTFEAASRALADGGAGRPR